MPNVPVVQVHLHPSDRLLLYTDGITERFSPAKEEFGMERLRQSLVEMGILQQAPDDAVMFTTRFLPVKF